MFHKGYLGEPILDKQYFTKMSCKALFLYIISMCDENIINPSGSYIENILNCYAASEL